MFTGIIEHIAVVKQIVSKQDNLEFTIESQLTSELKVDQSVAHNGVCLTVTEINHNTYTVVAIKETLQKTNLSILKIGDKINLERAMLLNQRLDGHMVQGHIDETSEVIKIENQNGSWKYYFSLNQISKHLVIPKGSITINGVSLTLVDVLDDLFSVCIIPYTMEHTTFSELQLNTRVNIEYDVLGKYVARNMDIKYRA